jgi:hypothetical protein
MGTNTTFDEVIQRVCGEFLEMPGLRLTLKQAQRLWGLDEPACSKVLDSLVDAKFLQRTDFDMYSRASEGAR